jgi:hypothetical protein
MMYNSTLEEEEVERTDIRNAAMVLLLGICLEVDRRHLHVIEWTLAN